MRKHLLNKSQRRQALVWLQVLGFKLSEIAQHYGIEINSLVAELRTARLELAAEMEKEK